MAFLFIDFCLEKTDTKKQKGDVQLKEKRKGKIDRHFPVYMDGHKCLILNYRVQNDHLTLITKLKNSNLGISGDTGELVIEKGGVKITYIVEHCTVYYGITIFNYGYHILEEIRTNISEENPDFSS